MKLILIFTFFLYCHFCGYAQVSFTDEEKAWIKAHPTVEFGYEPNWEPYNGSIYTGIVGDFVNHLEKATGIEFKPIAGITWSESLQRLKNGEIMMVLICAISPERKKELLFTDPYIIDPYMVATNKEYPYISGLHDLKGKRVVVPSNYCTAEFIAADYPEIELILAPTVRQCLEMVSTGDADAYVGSLGVMSYYINHKGFTNLKISAPMSFKDVRIAMAFSKDQEILRDICQKVINSISVEEVNAIRNKWIAVRYEYSFSWTKTLIISGIIVALFLIGFLIFVFWNRSLKREINRREIVEADLRISLEKIEKQRDENKILLQEIHHRVKNNLQVISSMMRMQSRVNEDAGARES